MKSKNICIKNLSPYLRKLLGTIIMRELYTDVHSESILSQRPTEAFWFHFTDANTFFGSG